jgi:hypothetical protein
VAGSDDATEISVSGVVFHQADGMSAGFGVGDFCADDRGDPVIGAAFDKRPQAVNIIRVGESEPPISKIFSGVAEFLR